MAAGRRGGLVLQKQKETVNMRLRIGPAQIRNWIIVPIMGALWLIGLLYQSGIGKIYDVYGKTKLLTICIFLWQFAARGKFQRIPRALANMLLILFIGNIWTYVKYGREVTDYLWVYLLIPLLGELTVGERQLRWISLMYGGLGGAVLFITNYGTAFGGWNTNSIGMLAFFSYVVFIASYVELREKKRIVILLLYSLVYYLWLEMLNSRATILFSLAALLCILSIIPLRKWLNRRMLLIWLLVPLLVAVVVVTVKDAGFVESLNSWSIQTFSKSLFNGRDRLWYSGFQKLWSTPFFGNGNLSSANWHNSAVTCLVGCGVVGYVCWLLVTRAVLSRGLKRLADGTVFGLMAAFLIIWFQQSVELGLIAAQANVVPYGILGLMWARVKTLEREDGEKADHDRPRL